MTGFNDQNFPLIKYQAGKTPLQWGQAHGECYRQAIAELVEIRKSLMLARNPKLEAMLNPLAMEQWKITEKFSPALSQELQGICQGSGLSIEDIVILNNYTDFRDIQLPEEGCSTVHVQREQAALSGQTWDMHRSAKKYLCLIHVPANGPYPESLVLSLVGCTGLMGITARGSVVGVNNINTQNARAGLIWPVLVRETLKGQDLTEMSEILKNAPVTSGHNYILSTREGGEHWEITPEVAARPAKAGPKKGESFHTNHCLAEEVRPLEMANSINSTTHQRYQILERKVGAIETLEDLYGLLTDHEQYPKSICSHFESGAQDPSFTCGGGIIAIPRTSEVTMQSRFWRGCPHEGDDYREYKFVSDGMNWREQPQ